MSNLVCNGREASSRPFGADTWERRQALETYPWLLCGLVENPCSYSEIVSAIDDRLPLGDLLAIEFEVPRRLLSWMSEAYRTFEPVFELASMPTGQPGKNTGPGEGTFYLLRTLGFLPSKEWPTNPEAWGALQRVCRWAHVMVHMILDQVCGKLEPVTKRRLLAGVAAIQWRHVSRREKRAFAYPPMPAHLDRYLHAFVDAGRCAAPGIEYEGRLPGATARHLPLRLPAAAWAGVLLLCDHPMDVMLRVNAWSRLARPRVRASMERLADLDLPPFVEPMRVGERMLTPVTTVGELLQQAKAADNCLAELVPEFLSRSEGVLAVCEHGRLIGHVTCNLVLLGDKSPEALQLVAKQLRNRPFELDWQQQVAASLKRRAFLKSDPARPEHIAHARGRLRAAFLRALGSLAEKMLERARTRFKLSEVSDEVARRIDDCLLHNDLQGTCILVQRHTRGVEWPVAGIATEPFAGRIRSHAELIRLLQAMPIRADDLPAEWVASVERVLPQPYRAGAFARAVLVSPSLDVQIKERALASELPNCKIDALIRIAVEDCSSFQEKFDQGAFAFERLRFFALGVAQIVCLHGLLVRPMSAHEAQRLSRSICAAMLRRGSSTDHPHALDGEILDELIARVPLFAGVFGPLLESSYPNAQCVRYSVLGTLCESPSPHVAKGKT